MPVLRRFLECSKHRSCVTTVCFEDIQEEDYIKWRVSSSLRSSFSDSCCSNFLGSNFSSIGSRTIGETVANLRLLVADDHELVRKGVRALLEEQSGWEVVAEASNGREAVEKAKLVNPDLTILDLIMPELNGIEATREIAKTIPAKILILTMYDSDELIRQALEAGAQGYLIKTDAGRELVTAVDALRRGKTFFTHKVAQMVLEGYLAHSIDKNGNRTLQKDGLRLTTRQKQILQLLADGKSSKEMAAALNISAKTAETHRANIMRRLDYHSVTQLVRYAIRNHVIEA